MFVKIVLLLGLVKKISFQMDSFHFRLEFIPSIPSVSNKFSLDPIDEIKTTFCPQQGI